MSDENVIENEAEQQQEPESRQAAEVGKAMDNITAGGEEKELDSNRVQKAMQQLAASRKADLEARLLREKELAAVKVNKEDIDVIAAEFEIDKKAAERKLRESNGVLIDALRSLLHAAA